MIGVQDLQSVQSIYSFILGQGKRPRRRYDEIDRVYKCGWQGCDKTYGTLNHLNAHVGTQSHGNKRTPECISILVCDDPLINVYSREIRKQLKRRVKGGAELDYASSLTTDRELFD